MYEALTNNVTTSEASITADGFQELQDDEAGVGMREGTGQAEPGAVEGVERERGAAPALVCHPACEGQGQHHAKSARGANERPLPFFAR